MKRLWLPLFCFLCGLNFAYCETEDGSFQDWSLLLYQGQGDENRFLELLTFAESPRPTKSRLSSLEIDKKLLSLWHDRLAIEGALNLTRRNEPSRETDFWEYNAFFIFRWQAFPWNHLAHTTISIGEGFSYAQRIPQDEVERPESPTKNTRHLLNFLSHEITIGTAKCKDWALVYRLHHRSGIFGVYGNVGSSNFRAVGVKYIFQADCSTFL